MFTGFGFGSCFSKFLEYIKKSFICSLSDFIMKAPRIINFPHRISFNISQSFCYVDFSFLSFTRFKKKLPLDFFLTRSLLNNELFDLQEFVYLLEICLLLILSFTSLWSNRTHKVISIFLLGFLGPGMLPILEKVPQSSE